MALAGTAALTHAFMVPDPIGCSPQVMKEMVRDDAQRMSEIVLALHTAATAGQLEDQADALSAQMEELQDIVEQVDMAQVFVKFHGSQLLLDLLESSAAPLPLRCQAAVVLGTLSQNNLVVQDALFQQGALDRLAAVYLQTDQPKLCLKVHHALSCLMRGHAAAEAIFCSGCLSACWKKALAAEHAGLISKLLFLSTALLSSDFASAERVHAIQQLILPVVRQLDAQDSGDLRDNLLAFLCAVLATQAGQQACLRGPEEGSYAEDIAAVVEAAEQWEDIDPLRLEALKAALALARPPAVPLHEPPPMGMLMIGAPPLEASATVP